MEEKIVSEASAAGDAEDNISSDDPRPCVGASGDGQREAAGAGVNAGTAAVAPRLKGDLKPSNKSRRRKEMLDRRGRRGRGGAQQRKRRRGGVNRNNNKNKSLKWPLPEGNGNRKDVIIPPLVPYNTNRFLMEYHMEEVPSATGPTVGRDEFITNEFSEVYETAKCERLEGLSKQQLIQEYLQIEANYDQLRLRLKAEQGNGSHSHSRDNRAKWESHWRALKDRVRRLTAENHELRLELTKLKGSLSGEQRTGDADDSVDSESDSSISTISSRSSSCSRSSSSSGSSSSSSGSCCSSQCSSRDSKGNVLPSRQNSDNEASMAESNGQPMDVTTGEAQGLNQNCRRQHRRHRTHRQRRNSRLNHSQSVGGGPTATVTLENGNAE